MREEGEAAILLWLHHGSRMWASEEEGLPYLDRE